MPQRADLVVIGQAKYLLCRCLFDFSFYRQRLLRNGLLTPPAPPPPPLTRLPCCKVIVVSIALFFLSNCSFLYSGVYLVVLKLSISDIKVTQKGSNGDGMLHFFGQTIFSQKECVPWHWASVRLKINLKETY